MKTLLFTIFLVMPQILFAQRLTCFTAEGVDYFDATFCPRGSTVDFYSSIHGGVYLGTLFADSNNRALFMDTARLHIEMVLDHGIGGTGHVAYVEDKDFIITSPSVFITLNNATIKWYGSVKPSLAGDLSFKVIQSFDDSTWQTVDTFSAPIDTVPHLCLLPDSLHNIPVYYKIVVVSRSVGIRYTTGRVLLLPYVNGLPVVPARASAITVYPTVVTDNILITIPELKDHANYVILNSNGKAVSSGSLEALQTIIPMSTLPAGNYIIFVRSQIDNKAMKVVKL